MLRRWETFGVLSYTVLTYATAAWESDIGYELLDWRQ